MGIEPGSKDCEAVARAMEILISILYISANVVHITKTKLLPARQNLKFAIIG